MPAHIATAPASIRIAVTKGRIGGALVSYGFIPQDDATRSYKRDNEVVEIDDLPFTEWVELNAGQIRRRVNKIVNGGAQ